MAYIIGILSTKGGVGKSSIARALAVAISSSGYRVRLCDLDIAQTTTVDWYKRRLQNGGDTLASVEMFRTVDDALKNTVDLQPSFDAIILDMPGRSSVETYKLAHAANLIIQPTSGTLDDLVPAVRLYHELKAKGIPYEKMAFTLNRITTEAEAAQALEYIRRTGYDVLDGILQDKAGYKMAQNIGRTLQETNYSTLNEAAEELLGSIINRLTGNR
ncbi:MAG: ParA family protein [Methylovulum sp.]|nr:ParA family protein [Methylovulum sp.]